LRRSTKQKGRSDNAAAFLYSPSVLSCPFYRAATAGKVSGQPAARYSRGGGRCGFHAARTATPPLFFGLRLADHFIAGSSTRR
jgi:hypothetical protein